MDFITVFFAVIVLIYVGSLIYLANQDEAERAVNARSLNPLTADRTTDMQVMANQPRRTILRWMLYGVAAMVFIYGLLILQLALFSGATGEAAELDVALPKVDALAASANFVLSVMVSIISFRLIASETLRQRIKRLTGTDSQYDPDSSIHLAAIVLALAFLAVTIGQLVLTGGLEGLAQDVQGGGISLNALAFQTILMIAIAFLGVGLALRRSLSQSLSRLGLRWPTRQDISWGVGIGIALIFVLQIMGTIWALFVPQEQISQQSAAADEIAKAFGTLPLAFLISATAAISEEILFRGAFQPVFGLGLTSIYFALIHMQYTLTPATLIIFVVALGLGWVRRRQSTTAAIIAHFVYNFTLLVISILYAGSV